jgi:hypothetical protein
MAATMSRWSPFSDFAAPISKRERHAISIKAHP